jgi:hypothetical protein
MVCDELDAARQCPPGRQELNGLHCIPAMLLVHTGSELPFLVGERSPLVTFQFSSSFCAEMSALSMPIDKLVSRSYSPDAIARAIAFAIEQPADDHRDR